MLVADSRSGVQVAAAEGSTKKADLRLGGGAVRRRRGAAGWRLRRTPTKARSSPPRFMDNYNNIVNVVRSDPSLQRNVGTLKQEAAAGRHKKAGAVFNEGDVLVPKIANVKLLASPADGAKTVATLAKGDELIFMGEEKNGFLNVDQAAARGWVKKVLVSK